MLWVKAFSIIFVVSWFTGLFLFATYFCESRHGNRTS